MIVGAQLYLLFICSVPFLGKCCFVRRLTTRITIGDSQDSSVRPLLFVPCCSGIDYFVLVYVVTITQFGFSTDL
jgi:hypothetical protein